jgi:NADH-quinone oxidoreductase subunit L
MIEHFYLIPLLPLIAFVINLFFGRRLGKNSAWISILASVAAATVAWAAAYEFSLAPSRLITLQWEWLPVHIGSDAYSLKFGALLDPLSVSLLFVVTFVGTLIQIYSLGYMDQDKRQPQFFAYLSLFMSAMLTLVISPNYIQFFMAWEIMGLCSYLLIGFWFERDAAANAARKAFLVTRLGDVAFLLGIITLFIAVEDLDFTNLSKTIASIHELPLLVAALLIFCGTIAKSAQFPLHIWLPDAMEGPTPVSALIHAATMVAAGVFLIARSFELFQSYIEINVIVTIIGTWTALMAAFLALAQNDIKRILAYSTISQLGFMVSAMGLGGLSAGSFHLITHAFFKALLFLAAGSVIHGTGTQDIRELGGLFKKMKQTALTFVIGALALAGVPPLSGFWSKDEILSTAYQSGHYVVFGILLFTSFLTALYIFRLVFIVFFGESRNARVHAHEAPASMTLPLWVLALGTIFIGLPGSPLMHHWFQSFLSKDSMMQINSVVLISSITAALIGLALAALMFLRKRKETKTSFPLNQLAGFFLTFDQKIVTGSALLASRKSVHTARFSRWLDRFILDGFANMVGHSMQLVSAILRLIQTGFVQHYLLILFVFVVAGAFWMRGFK